MDKNTIIGLVIIFLILIGFSYLNRPSEEQRREMMRRDSIARVEQQQRALEAQRLQEERENTEHSATGTSTRSTVFAQDSLAEQMFTLENDKIKLNISTRGGRITTVNLKEYCTHDSLPLLLWQEQSSSFGMNFYARNQEINTERFLFVPSTMETALYAKDNAQTLAMRHTLSHSCPFPSTAPSIAPQGNACQTNGARRPANVDNLSIRPAPHRDPRHGVSRREIRRIPENDPAYRLKIPI